MITETQNLIVPQVLSRMVGKKIGEKISLLPLAKIDNSLKGRPGDTLSFPCFRQIGKAKKVGENGKVELSLLSAETLRATVEKYAHGVCLTDEALLSGFGDPLGEAVEQLARSIDLALDEELYRKLGESNFSRKFYSFELNADTIADALSLFEENLDGDKALIIDPLAFSKLRKDESYIKASDIGQKMIIEGSVGSVWGCQVYVSNRLKGKNKAYIVKPGALRLISKSDTKLDIDRQAEFMRTNIYASKHCACYLYDESRLIELNFIKDAGNLPKENFTVEKEGLSLNVKIVQQAALGFEYFYKLSKQSQENDISGFLALSEGDIATGDNTYLHIALVKDGKIYMKNSFNI